MLDTMVTLLYIAIEKGRYSPTLEMAFQIARALDVPLDEVFHYPTGANS